MVPYSHMYRGTCRSSQNVSYYVVILAQIIVEATGLQSGFFADFILNQLGANESRPLGPKVP